MTVFRDNREPDPTPADAAQIAAGVNDAPKIPVAERFPGGDKALADSINELKEKDAEYKRLQSSEAREQWENITRANLLRQHEQEEQRTGKAALDTAWQQFQDDTNDSALLRHADELVARLRELPNGYTEQTLPLDLYRDIAVTNQQFEAAASRRGITPPDGGLIPTTWPPPAITGQTAQPSPQPGASADDFPEGQLYKMTNLPDGTIEVKLKTNEVYRGDPLTVMQKLAESKVHTTLWAKQQVSQAQTQANGNGNGSVPTGTNGNGDLGGHTPEFGQWVADEQAKALGFRDRNEMLEWGENVNKTVSEVSEFIEEQRDQKTATQFQMQNPDFPNTDQAINAVATILERNGWAYTPDTLAAAHSLAVRQGLYQPLTPEEQRAAVGIESPQTRPSPPPMIRSNSPDATQRVHNEWTEPLDQLKARLIRQQLEQTGVNPY